MRRNPWERQRREMERAARQAAASAPGTSTGHQSGERAGASHPATGEWTPYGRLSFTRLREGFRVRG
jgi:hypothetical protein